MFQEFLSPYKMTSINGGGGGGWTNLNIICINYNAFLINLRSSTEQIYSLALLYCS